MRTKKIKAKHFKHISIRGRLAYAICCLENMLEFYNIKGEGWNWYLKKLWWYTELATKPDPEISNNYQAERWHSIINKLSPDYIRELTPTYELVINNAKAKVFYKEDLPSEEEFLMLKEAYKQSNQIVEETITNIFHIGCCELWCAVVGYSKDTLNYLQNILSTMYEQGIPLPSVEPFKQYVFYKDGWDYDLHGFGEMFDGTQYSKFVNTTK